MAKITTNGIHPFVRDKRVNLDAECTPAQARKAAKKRAAKYKAESAERDRRESRMLR
jgi:hypothetical protein